MLETTGKKSRSTTKLLTVAMALLLAIGMTAFLQGKTAAQDQPTNEAKMKVPETAKDHYAMAEHYRKVEAQTRQEIETHKEMLAEFKKTAAVTPKTGENPYVKDERLHCEKYIKAAEAMAAEAAESARFHTLRAKELEGK